MATSPFVVPTACEKGQGSCSEHDASLRQCADYYTLAPIQPLALEKDRCTMTKADAKHCCEVV